MWMNYWILISASLRNLEYAVNVLKIACLIGLMSVLDMQYKICLRNLGVCRGMYIWLHASYDKAWSGSSVMA